MIEIDTLIHARWIIPVEPVGIIHENYSLVIHQGRILDLLPTEEVALHYRSKVSVNRSEHVLIPGLINAHTHAAMSLFRGLADDLALMDWLNHHIWPAEQRWVDESFVRDGVLLSCAEMLRSGTTCFNDMYFFPDQSVRVIHEVGMRACVGLIIIDFPTGWAQNSNEYIAKAETVYHQFNNQALVHFAFAPHAPYTVSDVPLRKAVTLAERYNLPIHMHVHETAHEISQAEALTGERPLQRMLNLGMLSSRLLAVHMTQLTGQEIEMIAQRDVSIVHCPQSNLKLASGISPVSDLHQAGVNVALGTDGAASNNRLDMFSEMRAAALLAKIATNDPQAVNAATVLQMATLNGAKALHIATETGSLKVGKAADIVAVDLSALENQPLYDPLSQLVYSAGREHVTDVWVAGRQLLVDRELTSIDRLSVLAKARLWCSKIRSTDEQC